MFIYIAIFVTFAFLAVTKLWNREKQIVIPVVVAGFLTLFVGYRYQIGVDWVTYEIIFLDDVRSSLLVAIGEGDSAYSFINWVVGRLGGQVWHVNLICAALFSVALAYFCRLLPRPGLALVIALPTLIIITAMGYTRQSAAVACIMLACHHFHGTINWRWLGWLCLAVLFHKSALLIFPAFILAGSQYRWLSIAVGGAIGLAALILVVARGLAQTLALYLEGDIDSSGALPRILVGALGGIAFFLAIDRKHIFGERHSLYRNLAIMMIAMLPLYFLFPSRTIVDRIGILLVPFQSMAYAGMAETLWRRSPALELAFTVSVTAMYGAMLGVWLLFATFASYWLPYTNVLFVKWI